MQFIGTGDRILTENFNIGYLYTITFTNDVYINSACIGKGDNFVMFQRTEPDLIFNLNVESADEVSTIELYDSGGGTNDYDDLSNKPQINSITLSGNKSSSDLGLQDTISDLATIRSGAAAGATAVQPADMTAALATKQDTLSSAQLAAVNSGITSTDVAQIETNKNNILLITPALTECVDNGAKNMLNITSVDMSWATINADKSITVNYTTSSSNQFVHIGFNNKSTTAYVPTPSNFIGALLSGIVETVSGVLLIMEFSNDGTSWASEVNVSAQTGARALPNYPYCRLVIRFFPNIPSGTYTFKPMICEKSLYDVSPTFQPYAMSNLELTAAIQALQAQLNQ